jgi:hypothetical protein
MKAMNPWITYRTRFLVKAKQLTGSLSFTDELGRQHSGTKGDYLVEWSDGVLRIAPQKIFEDVYVPIAPTEELPQTVPGHFRSSWGTFPDRTTSLARSAALSIAPHMIRKSPQPCRDRRTSRPGLALCKEL